MTEEHQKVRLSATIGRPPKYDNAQELGLVIEKYFRTLQSDEGKFWLHPPTVSGLAYSVGMTTRSLLNYEEKDEFFPIISRAKQICELYLEENAIKNNAKVCISLLSMNFGRVETKAIEHNLNDDLANLISNARNRTKPNEKSE